MHVGRRVLVIDLIEASVIGQLEPCRIIDRASKPFSQLGFSLTHVYHCLISAGVTVGDNDRHERVRTLHGAHNHQ